MALRRIDEGLALPLQRRGAVWWSDPPGYSRVNRSTLAASAGTERMVPVAAWEWYCTRVAAAKTRAIIRQVGLLAPRRTAPSYRGEAGLRQRDISSRSKRMNALWRLLAVVSLAVSLVLSLSPLAMTPVVAAPLETIRQATDSSDIAADSGTKTESPPTAEMPQLPDKKDQLSADIAPQDRTDDGDGSVRQRGVEAPVLFEQQTAQGADRPQEKSKTSDKSQKPERDPGDGPVKNSQEPAKKRDLTRAQSGIRIWPMPAKSYTFTQHFGCVPQLGNLYASLEGCPANAPVFHTGIDLAAPEGTPFYAAASGWVILADYDRPTADANTRITIQHDGRNEGYSTDYLHWVASYVEEGDYVHAGDPIGEVGNVGFSTGPHLHFSVTDLGTGEHVDPLRWLPDEPGLEGYVSRKPNARLRLPAGTTAGQPESADPAPPSPAVKEDVPKSPAKDGKRNKQGERIREEHHTKASGDPAAGDPRRIPRRAIPRRAIPRRAIPRRAMPSARIKSGPATTRHPKPLWTRRRMTRRRLPIRLASGSETRTERHRKTLPPGKTVGPTIVKLIPAMETGAATAKRAGPRTGPVRRNRRTTAANKPHGILGGTKRAVPTIRAANMIAIRTGRTRTRADTTAEDIRQRRTPSTVLKPNHWTSQRRL